MATIDYEVNQRGDLVRNTDGTFSSIGGREAFEQRIALVLSGRLYELIGDRSRSEIVERLEMEAERVANNSTNIESMPVFEIEFSETQRDRVLVTILYNTGEATEFPI